MSDKTGEDLMTGLLAALEANNDLLDGAFAEGTLEANHAEGCPEDDCCRCPVHDLEKSWAEVKKAALLAREWLATGDGL